MKIAIWGSYAYGNYGDELMALHYACHLESLGVEPVVYRLRDALAQKYEIEVAATADELVQDAAFCVFGGGSLLSGNKNPPQWYDDRKRREYEALTEAIEKHSCPLYFLSIGGDGDFGDGTGIATYRQRLLKSEMCRTATIRQEPDVALIEEKFGIDAVYYPDVLLNVKEFWGIEPPRTDKDKVHVGLNLPTSFDKTARLLNLCRRFKDGTVFHFVNTVRPREGKEGFGGELMKPECKEYIRQHVYDDPIDLLRFLSRLDIIFSFKLHIGLTATALGVPLVCVEEKLKTKAFLHSIEADFAYWGNLSKIRVKGRFLQTALSPRRIRRLQAKFSGHVNIQEQIDASWGHLDALESVLQEHTR